MSTRAANYRLLLASLPEDFSAIPRSQIQRIALQKLTLPLFGSTLVDQGSTWGTLSGRIRKALMLEDPTPALLDSLFQERVGTTLDASLEAPQSPERLGRQG